MFHEARLVAAAGAVALGAGALAGAAAVGLRGRRALRAVAHLILGLLALAVAVNMGFVVAPRRAPALAPDRRAAFETCVYVSRAPKRSDPAADCCPGSLPVRKAFTEQTMPCRISPVACDPSMPS